MHNPYKSNQTISAKHNPPSLLEPQNHLTRKTFLPYHLLYNTTAPSSNPPHHHTNGKSIQLPTHPAQPPSFSHHKSSKPSASTILSPTYPACSTISLTNFPPDTKLRICSGAAISLKSSSSLSPGKSTFNPLHLLCKICVSKLSFPK